MFEPCGHVDFYPNGGQEQPGCNRFVVCDHLRAAEFFIASVNHGQCTPLAFECSDYESFKKGRCADCGANGEKCAFMGMAADSFRRHKNDQKSARVFLSTRSDAPYCRK